MPDPTLDEVLQEAYASASPDKVIIDTISVYYDGLVNAQNAPDELYLFTGENATEVSDEGLPLLLARIEDDAPRRAGELVTHLGIPFAITLPPMTTDSVAAAQITIDSVGRELHDILEAAAKAGKPIEITYRAYVKGLETLGPQSLPPARFVLVGANGGSASVSGRLAFLSIGNRPYPFDIYSPETFRTLQYA